MQSRSVGQLLGTLPELRDLTRDARRLLLLQHCLDAKLPPGLRGLAAVAACSAGTVVIFTENGAAAAKLRQVSRRILTHLRQLDPELNAIQIRAQVRTNINPLPRKQNLVSKEACQALIQLAGRLPPSALRTAIEQLAKRHTTYSHN